MARHVQSYRYSSLQTSFAELLFSEPHDDEDLALQPTTIPVYRVALVREGEQSLLARPVLTEPMDAAQIFASYLCDADRECFATLMVDVRNRFIGLNTVSVGGLDRALICPAQVFKPAILCNAPRVVVCHNHPSGDPQPSPEDQQVTLRLSEAGRLLDIELLDHIVLGERGSFWSFRERGQI